MMFDCEQWISGAANQDVDVGQERGRRADDQRTAAELIAGCGPGECRARECVCERVQNAECNSRYGARV